MESIGTWWMWAAFAAIVLVMLLVDLFAFGGGKQHRVSLKEAAGWSLAWVTVSLLFAAGLWWYLDGTMGRAIANDKALAFVTGYLVEKSLAVDNVFVWMMIFSFFAVPLELQRRVLLYGIVGAIVLRTIMIFAGSWLIAEFHWLLYVFGAFLVITGVKMVWFAEHDPDLEKNPFVRWIRNHYPVTEGLEGERFFVMRDGVRMITPLFLALVLVEISDVIFAVDSIPAIFAITTDPFIVLTSNLFAILGLRAMYFLLADLGDRFELLKYGLATILVFIGTKMLIVEWIKIPVLVSLGVVAVILAIAVVASLWYSAKKAKPLA
ncbi:TerC family protein [Thauera linaloolentis]|uniref:Integral membrane protein TerC n=1 Tax=Thauera linaloolentis (strain DSM 12138 / JCM 21573 / CCUG 41526 / CIP 105981 / IAM 15112 / NBRC 102519 / 47Lol) TaxID=1123367 RepID=N6YRN4_THAL4|nr:TerC family protein [Thauera linaloolentis]ENO84848.1 integral membrane protein TerC [Thauera linaloolentis 47Lol = DSM 12138]MCM8564853.1 TerC family protein [Thauera linaloolentis]